MLFHSTLYLLLLLLLKFLWMARSLIYMQCLLAYSPNNVHIWHIQRDNMRQIYHE